MRLNQSKDKKESIIIASLMAVFFVLVAFGLSFTIRSVPAIEIVTDAEDSESYDSSGYEGYLFSRPHSLLKDLEQDDSEEFVPDAETLNLAFFYADDADTDDAIYSFAGTTYQALNSMCADLYASFYDLTDVTPLSQASSMGLGASRVMGSYNPNDSAHDPGNPSTWTVNSFSNVSVSFYDGDGNRIDGYYPAEEIMSLANVYMYYHDDYDPEHFKEYCEALFDEAVSYKISLGSVYYCSGCLNKTTADESAEALAIEAEELALANNISLDEAYALLDTIAPESEGDADETTLEVIIDNTGESETTIGVIPYTDTDFVIYDTHSESTENAVFEETEPDEAGIEQPSSESETETQTAETEPQTTAPPTAEPETEPASTETEAATESPIEYIYDPGSTGPLWTANSLSTQIVRLMADETGDEIEEIYDSSYETKPSVIYQETSAPKPEETTEISGSEYAVYNSAQGSTPKYYINDEGVVEYGETREGYEGDIGESEEETLESFDAETPETETEVPDVEALRQAEAMTRIQTLLGQANIQTSTEAYCPGHIDIYVTVTIRGIDDINGLFKVDAAGNDEESYNDKWQGWTEEMKAAARALNAKDWFEEYGLSISSISLSSTLTEADIAAYLATLPADISDLRRSIVEYALNSVGKVPYYWGGKPSGPGYTKNSFGILISPDTRGRILKGLDCSGWVNWIYWSVTGQSLAGQSTGTLVGCGRKISRSELEPGDIIIRVGGDAHVVMFLCWAQDGDFYAIHETGGVINNVTVSKMTANWPYYRSLAD